MSNGEDEPQDADAQPEAEEADAGEVDVEVTVESLDERLDAVAEALESADTESDLDDVEADLDAVATAFEDAEFDVAVDEDEEDPVEALEGRIDALREELEDARGPYAEDVADAISEAKETLESSEWTEDGEPEALAAVDAFLADLNEALDADVRVSGSDRDDYAAALATAAEAVEDAGLDADADADTIGALLEATDDFEAALDDAEVWSDLTVVEQLTAQGFYDRLESENRKDFPPELGVVRIAEKENDPERILLALENLDSEFMQENCIDALRRMGAEEAFDAMSTKAQRRDRPAIEVLGKIGNPEALEMLHGYIEGESNPPLQKTTLRAIGEIGSPDSTQHVADRLVAEDYEVRSIAARALGLIGDTRAVDPLADVLADDDEDAVRASAAWALRQIGTKEALEQAAQYTDDRAFIVQTEAEKADDALAVEA
ncbi:HEAT repeat domain-containing protein [Natronomonas sp. EA1]|uniref:HEAT repeat domain-containing protein n=1 Tax=Natronomonas sp. EA1 TaxID=3421655 RepID=UPI003EBC63A7